MAKRYRRSHSELISDLKSQIQELETKQKSREAAKDPAVKAMRMVRVHLRKACGLIKPDSPLPEDLVNAARGFLKTLDEGLVGLGTRKPRTKKST